MTGASHWVLEFLKAPVNHLRYLVTGLTLGTAEFVTQDKNVFL